MKAIFELPSWKGKHLFWIDVPIVDPERAVVHNFWIEDIRNLGFDPIWYGHENGIMLGFQTRQEVLDFLPHSPEEMWQRAKKRCNQMQWVTKLHENDAIILHLRALLKCPASEVFNRIFDLVGEVDRLRDQKRLLTESLHEMHRRENVITDN